MASSIVDTSTIKDDGRNLRDYLISSITTMFNNFTSKAPNVWFNIPKTNIYILHQKNNNNNNTEIHVNVTAKKNILIPFLRLLHLSSQTNILDSEAVVSPPTLPTTFYFYKVENISMSHTYKDPMRNLKLMNPSLQSIVIKNNNDNAQDSELYFIISYNNESSKLTEDNVSNHKDAFQEEEDGIVGGKEKKTVIFRNMTKKQLLEYSKKNNVQHIKTSFRKEQIISILERTTRLRSVNVHVF